jgi:uncharacterized protein (TIGR02246 family)
MIDEDKIKDVLRNWRCATANGDLPQLLTLMAEDVVFLAAGQPPLRGRDAFAAHFRAAVERVRLEPTGELQEIGVAGDLAYCWSEVVLKVTPRDPAPELRLAGADLTILRREPDGRWLVFRAASMLTPEQEHG